MNKLMNKFLPVDPRESSLDTRSAALIEHIRRSLLIQNEMFRRILDTTPKPSVVLAELLEDTGNRYLDFSERVSAVSAASRGERSCRERSSRERSSSERSAGERSATERSANERSCRLKSMPYPSR